MKNKIKQDDRIKEIELSIEEFLKKENSLKFQSVMKTLAEQVFQGEMEPLEAYYGFFSKGQKIFPKSFNRPQLRSMLYHRFQLYLLICILGGLGKFIDITSSFSENIEKKE